MTRRLILAAAFLLLGAVLLAYSVMKLFSPETGWQTIQADAGLGSGDSFTFLYQVRSTAEAKGVTALYTQACQESFQLFHSGQEYDGVTNLATINRHPNEELEVDEGLYRAFSVMAAGGRRELYLGPVYERYDDIFYCQDDAQLADFDPRLSEAVREEYAAVLAYANDPRAIDLELLDGNRVRLKVSDAYLAWAEQEEIVRFIDFSWMSNAFIADYIADRLTAGGYTAGVLSSYDGFSRNLDGREVDYAYPLYARRGDAVYPPAELHYSGPMSLVRMRDYPLSQQDLRQYYKLRTGEFRTMYLDTADALCKSSVDTLLCYSREKGCAQLLLEMIPVYIAGTFREEAIPALAKAGVQSVYCREDVILYTDPEAVLEDLYAGEDIRYTVEQVPS